MSEIQFKYFYGTEADTFTFYRIPKLLVTHSYFDNVSNDAKMLYGLMLDRMSLSAKNGWFDEENRVFIKFSIKDAMKLLKIGKNKAIKLFAELDTVDGVGLIERKNQGQGKPAVIYVKSFMSEVLNSNRFENETTSGSDIKPLEVSKANTNKNKYNNTLNELDANPIDSELKGYELLIRKNLEIDALIERDPYDSELYEGIYELVLETVLFQGESMVIASSRYPMNLIRSKFMKLNIHHVEYVVESLRSTTSKVKNIKKYMLTMLFNAPTTISSYYIAEVNHDMAAGL
ncbi:MAG: replication initiator protein A [Pseudobutyrivibrio sp.]|nr:replication initiator protein A [Pseudobutyrivibrio sp.]